MSLGKIGVGIITMGVRKIHPNIKEKSRQDNLVHVEVDTQRVGPAITRNRCLKYLMDQGCDHLFMFDDDCYPMMLGWEEYFINTAKEHNVHFLGLPNPFGSFLLSLKGELAHWHTVLGCFSYQDRKIMEAVGYYNTAYTRYGSEDVARNWRVMRSGLCGSVDGRQGHAAPFRAAAYIMSEDAYHMNPPANLTVEEKQHFIKLNEPVYEAEIRSGRLYYPYSDTKV